MMKKLICTVIALSMVLSCLPAFAAESDYMMFKPYTDTPNKLEFNETEVNNNWFSDISAGIWNTGSVYGAGVNKIASIDNGTFKIAYPDDANAGSYPWGGYYSGKGQQVTFKSTFGSGWGTQEGVFNVAQYDFDLKVNAPAADDKLKFDPSPYWGKVRSGLYIGLQADTNRSGSRDNAFEARIPIVYTTSKDVVEEGAAQTWTVTGYKFADIDAGTNLGTTTTEGPKMTFDTWYKVTLKVNALKDQWMLELKDIDGNKLYTYESKLKNAVDYIMGLTFSMYYTYNTSHPQLSMNIDNYQITRELLPYVEAAPTITQDGDAVTAKVKFYNEAFTYQPQSQLIIATYGENNVLTKVSFSDITEKVPSSDSSKQWAVDASRGELEATATITKSAGDVKARAFVWTDLNSIKPMIGVGELDLNAN